jgi:hypothetical protein
MYPVLKPEPVFATVYDTFSGIGQSFAISLCQNGGPASHRLAPNIERMMTMKTPTIATAMAAFLLSGGIVAAHPGGMSDFDANDDGNVTRAEVSAKINERFAQLDTDGDGKVSESELAAIRDARRAERFDRLDTNGDGSLSRAEMDAAHQKRAEGRGKRGAWATDGKMHARLDANGDGEITKADIEARAFKHFERMDSNGDGTITE